MLSFDPSSALPSSDSAAAWLVLPALAVVLLPLAVQGARRAWRHRRSQQQAARKRAQTRASKQQLLAELEADAAAPRLADELQTLRLPELQRRLRARELTAAELARAALLRALRADRDDNSICEICPDWAARAAASDARLAAGAEPRPLEGLPCSLKECLRYPGLDATIGFGSLCFQPAEQPSPIVELLWEQGAVPIVTTNLPQTMLTFECANPVYGETHNPHMAGRSCGGSSGGEAVLHARRAVPFGIGTDIGGSVRIPAAFCGTVGLKPTKYRISCAGIRSSMMGQTAVPATTGPMAPDVLGCKVLFEALVDNVPLNLKLDPPTVPLPFNKAEWESKRPLKIGYFMGNSFFPPTPAVQRGVKEALEMLRRAGHTVTELPDPPFMELIRTYYALVAADGGDTIKSLYETDPVEPRMKQLVDVVKLPQFVHTLAQYLPANRLTVLLAATGRKSVRESWALQHRQHQAFAAFMQQWHKEQIDVLITPANVMPAARQGTCSDLTICCWPTFLFNLLDMPAGIVPITTVTAEDDKALLAYPEKDRFDRLMKAACADSMGLPVAVQVVGPRWHEERVLRVMYELEQANSRSS